MDRMESMEEHRVKKVGNKKEISAQSGSQRKYEAKRNKRRLSHTTWQNGGNKYAEKRWKQFVKFQLMPTFILQTLSILQLVWCLKGSKSGCWT